MPSFNKITIVGYLGRDPEIRYTAAGDAVCSFSIATTERRKNAEGELADETTWFKITVWRRQAELANQYLSKGKQVYVEGRLRQVEFTDREGNKRTALEVNASDIQFLSTKGDNAGDDTANANAAAVNAQAPTRNLKPVANANAKAALSKTVVEEEDIPF